MDQKVDQVRQQSTRGWRRRRRRRPRPPSPNQRRRRRRQILERNCVSLFNQLLMSVPESAVGDSLWSLMTSAVQVKHVHVQRLILNPPNSANHTENDVYAKMWADSLSKRRDDDRDGPSQPVVIKRCVFSATLVSKLPHHQTSLAHTSRRARP